MSSLSSLNTPITAGIAGLGRAGWGLHLQPMLALPSFKIVAVADPLPERCQEAADLTGCGQFASIDELLEKSEAQLVVVATPSLTHCEDALKVLEAGRHCIIEKPVALEAGDAAKIVSVAREKGLGVFVHHIHLHRGEYYHLRDIIASGVLGELFEIRTSWSNYARRWDWQTLRKNGGGQLNNTCPHVLSVVLPLLGSPVKEVFADLRNIKDVGDAEDHVHAVLKTESGVVADITVSSALALTGPKWMICGNRGTLISDGKTSQLKYYDKTKVEPLTVLDAAAPGRKYLKETLPWEEKEIKVEACPVRPFHENVLEVLTGGAAQVVTLESAAEVVRVSVLIQEAATK